MHDVLLQMAVACGARDGLVYVMSSETRGPRELELLLELGTTRDGLATTHRSVRWQRVIKPNAADTEIAVQRARRLWPHLLVPNHNGLDVEGWAPEDYSTLKRQLVERFAVLLVAGPHWAWSDNERRGANAALARGVPIHDLSGGRLSARKLREQTMTVDAQVRAQLAEVGWSAEQVEAFAPAVPIDESGDLSDGSRSDRL